MGERETYTVEVAGLTRHLPIFEVAPGVSIAVFNMLGDTEVVKASAAALAELLKDQTFDVFVTPEAKSIPLAHELSSMTGIPYIVLRKSRKLYMGETISAETVSITTGTPQTLHLGESDQAALRAAQVCLIDDVVSTGSTLKGMEAVMDAAGAQVNAIAAVFTEGDQDWSRITALGNLPVFINK